MRFFFLFFFLIFLIRSPDHCPNKKTQIHHDGGKTKKGETQKNRNQKQKGVPLNEHN